MDNQKKLNSKQNELEYLNSSQIKMDTETKLIEDLNFTHEVEPGETLEFIVQSKSTGAVANGALISFRFFNRDDDEITPNEWTGISDSAGPYKYLTTDSDSVIELDHWSVRAPEEACKVVVSGKQWRKNVRTQLVGPLRLLHSSKGEVLQQLPDGTKLEYSSKNFFQIISIEPTIGSVTLKVEYIPKTPTGVIPLRVHFIDADQKEMLPVGDLPINPKFGAFISLSGGEEVLTESLVTLSVPEGASDLRIQGIDWGTRTATLVGPLTVETITHSHRELNSFLNAIPENEPLIVIDTTAPPLGHDTLALRPNNLSAAYARQGVWVIFIPFSSVQEQPLRPSERLFQINRRDFDYLIQTILERRAPESSYFICSSFPSIQSNTAAELLKTAGWDITYEVRDDMEEFNRVGYSKWYNPALERLMLRIAHRVICVSSALDEKLQMMLKADIPRYIIPNAVNRQVIDNGLALRKKRADDTMPPSRKVGYVGHLTNSWFDWSLLIEAANRCPDLLFEIVGHGMPTGISLPSNVLYLGPKTHAELEEIVPEWQVGLIPFADLPLTRSVDPNKIYEYFAWGLRCVTAPMGLVHEYPSTWVYKGVDEFVEMLNDAVYRPYSTEEFEQMEEFVATASWDDRAVTMMETIGIPTRKDKKETR